MNLMEKHPRPELCKIHVHKQQFHKVVPLVANLILLSAMLYPLRHKRQRYSAEMHCKGTKSGKAFVEYKMLVAIITLIFLEFTILRNEVTYKVIVS